MTKVKFPKSTLVEGKFERNPYLPIDLIHLRKAPSQFILVANTDPFVIKGTHCPFNQISKFILIRMNKGVKSFNIAVEFHPDPKVSRLEFQTPVRHYELVYEEVAIVRYFMTFSLIKGEWFREMWLE
jgi:hypothetical protein